MFNRLFFVFSVLTVLTPLQAAELPLQDYLQGVKNGHQGVGAA